MSPHKIVCGIGHEQRYKDDVLEKCCSTE